MEEKSSNRTAVDLDSKMERRRLSPAKKKKRNHPGISFPDAEVIAISPRSLMATNRFICEMCKKGFQREQNLQLHRRGHNLPWKLRQKSSSSSSSSKQVSKRRVYLCPEPTCVHHHPSRALGDLTGVKKHFSRKHGEKKWNCDKCDKRYAVQSDWKAHSKTCGTRDYSCDCGTLFSRRDSFITHRAFCNVFPQEAATVSRVPSYHLYGSNSGTGGSDNLMPTFPSSRFLFGGLNQDSFPSSLTQYRILDLHISKNLQLDHDICNNQNDPFMFEQFSVGGNANLDPFNIGSFYNNDQSAFSFPHMSATALLQKPAEIGATTTTPPILNNNSNGNGNGNGNSSVLGNMTGSPIQYELPVGNEAHLQGLISSLVTENIAGMFGRDMQQHAAHHAGVLTRDFLGVEREPDPTNFTQQIPYGAANFQ